MGPGNKKEKLRDRVARLKKTGTNRVKLIDELTDFRENGRIKNEDVGELIRDFVEGKIKEVELGEVIGTLNEVFENINWRKVYEWLSQEGGVKWSQEYLEMLVDCWVSVSGRITIPYEVFMRPEVDQESRRGFLRVVVDSDPKKTQLYSNIFFKRLISKEERKQSRYKRVVEYESNLNCIELFQCMKESDARDVVRRVKDKSVEYAVLGLFSVEGFCEDMLHEAVVELVDLGTANFVFQILFMRGREKVFLIFEKIRDKVKISRILDILVEHKQLSLMIEVLQPESLAYDVIILAARREHLNLEMWIGSSKENEAKAFLDHIYNRIEKDEVDGDIFPLTKELLLLSIKALGRKDLGEDGEVKIKKLRNKINPTSEKGFSKEKAVAFVSEIVNSQAAVAESVKQVRELLRGEEGGIVFAKRIFGLLVDNYSNLYRLPNSDMLARFFGELILQKVFIKPYLRVALQLVRCSLVAPSNDREFAFAMKILEVFLENFPEFLDGIEDIPAIKEALVERELILLDEDFQQPIDLDLLIKRMCCKGEEDIKFTDEEMLRYVRDASYDIGNVSEECAKSAVLAKLSAIALRGESESESIVPSSECIAAYIFCNILSNPELWAAFVQGQSIGLQEYVVDLGFEIAKSIFLYKITANELEIMDGLGTLIGLVVLGQDRVVTLDRFDFKSFLHKGIEYRRIAPCVFFVTAFFRQGTAGSTCIPNNPWLMDIMDFLAELHGCTPGFIRKRIKGLYSHFNLSFPLRPSFKTKDHLVKYILPLDGLLKQVVSAALDFSVREVCNKLIHAAITIASATAIAFFQRIQRDDAHFFFFRNILVNLTRALISVSAREPLKASLCGNITQFLRLSGADLSLDDISGIAAANISLCSGVVERAAVTSVCEQAPTFYSVLRSKVTSSSNTEFSLNRIEKILSRSPITAESIFVEKTHIRSIESNDFQDIRGFILQLAKNSKASQNHDTLDSKWLPLLEPSSNRYFQGLINDISVSPERDSICLNLSKFLVGHAISSNNPFLFYCIARIMTLSFRTESEVRSWLLYSDDTKRFSVPLIRQLIRHSFIKLEEYDQTLTRLLSTKDSLDFVLSLLTDLILGDIRVCTVYDFIHTIESINGINDSPHVFEFFKSIEASIMSIGSTPSALFDDFVLYISSNLSSEAKSSSSLYDHYKVFSKSYHSPFVFEDALRSAWHHFVIYSAPYRFFKVDVLARIVVDDFYTAAKHVLSFLSQAHAKRCYLFGSFTARFFLKAFDAFPDSPDFRAMALSITSALSPTNIPSFIPHYISLLKHWLICKALGLSDSPNHITISTQAVWNIMSPLIVSLRYSTLHEHLVAELFNQYSQPLTPFFPYFATITPDSCPSLKNVFSRMHIDSIPEKTSNPFFVALRSIKTASSIPYNFLIDYLGVLEKHISDKAACMLREMVQREDSAREIVLLLLIRRYAAFPPPALVALFEEFVASCGSGSSTPVSSIISEYRKKYM